jgi:hypothetical protein
MSEGRQAIEDAAAQVADAAAQDVRVQRDSERAALREAIGEWLDAGTGDDAVRADIKLQDMLDKLSADSTARDERLVTKARFAPMGAGHHDVFTCPYCASKIASRNGASEDASAITELTLKGITAALTGLSADGEPIQLAVLFEDGGVSRAPIGDLAAIILAALLAPKNKVAEQ